MNPSVFDHIPVQIAATVIGVFLTGLIGIMIKLHNKVIDQSTRLAIVESALLDAEKKRDEEKERLLSSWDKVEHRIDTMESKIEAQLREMSNDMRALVKDMHSEFMRCPNHRAHGAGGF